MIQQVEQQLDEQRREYKRLTEEPGSIQELQTELQKLTSEVGRVWRNLEMQNVTPQGITLALTNDQEGDAEANDAGEDQAALINETAIVYGFAEQETSIGAETFQVPVRYLGEFTVTSSTPNQVTIKITGMATAQQRQLIESGRVTNWSLYELLPLDGHQPFMVSGSQPSDTNMFGRVDTELLNALFQNRLLPQTLDAYTKDGESAGEDSDLITTLDQAEVDDDSDLTAGQGRVRNEKLTRWSKIRFLKTFTETVDSGDDRAAVDGGFFDFGLAVDRRLKREGNQPVRFVAGDEIFVAADVAIRLRDSGDAEILANFNVRTLNDYRFVLRRATLRLREVRDRFAQLTQQKSILEQTMEMTDALTQKNQIDKNQLELDIAQIGKEREAISAYSEKLQREIESTRQQLISLFRQNAQLAAQLKQYHDVLLAEADARVQQAVSAP